MAYARQSELRRASRGPAAACKSSHSDIVDNAEAGVIHGTSIVDQLSRLPPGDFHIQDVKVAVSRVSLNLPQALACGNQDLSSSETFSYDNRSQCRSAALDLLIG